MGALIDESIKFAARLSRDRTSYYGHMNYQSYEEEAIKDFKRALNAAVDASTVKQYFDWGVSRLKTLLMSDYTLLYPTEKITFKEPVQQSENKQQEEERLKKVDEEKKRAEVERREKLRQAEELKKQQEKQKLEEEQRHKVEAKVMKPEIKQLEKVPLKEVQEEQKTRTNQTPHAYIVAWQQGSYGNIPNAARGRPPLPIWVRISFDKEINDVFIDQYSKFINKRLNNVYIPWRRSNDPIVYNFTVDPKTTRNEVELMLEKANNHFDSLQ
jgi:flagellar biosynthesis GTPase FlhF